MPQGDPSGYVDNLKNKTVNFPILGTVSILTAGIVIVVGFYVFTKTNLFKKSSPKRANISYEY
jgi:hypothetical protein|tara:strand:- start:182 stop:370 length:189 start_codon:yes stop_codon:yes gene_type:complete